MASQLWTVPGAPVKGYVWEAEQPRGAVLLSHGVGEYAGRYFERYHGLIPALLEQGLTVYAYDQRGHGESDGKRAVVDVDWLVEDHLLARSALRDLDVPLFAFGHSMGGLVTAASVTTHQHGLAGVILSSPALLVGQDESPLLKRLAPVLAKVSPGMGVTDLATGGLSRYADEVSAYSADTVIFQGKIPALTASSMLSLSACLWPRYPQWKVPTLIFHGSADQITDPRGSRRFAEAIASEDKTFVEFEGGYHELLNDHPRAEVRELVLDWLRQRIG